MNIRVYFLVFLVYFLFGCKKESENSATKSAKASVAISDTSGYLGYTVLRGKYKEADSTKLYRDFNALFFDSTDLSLLYTAGKVTCEGIELDFGKGLGVNPNITTIYYSSDTSFRPGPAYDGSIEWYAQGSSDVPGFTYSDNYNFPYVSVVQSDDTFYRNKPFTLMCDTVSNADSVIFMSNFDQSAPPEFKTLSGNVNSYTFSMNELTNLRNTTGELSPPYIGFIIYAYNTHTDRISGKGYIIRHIFASHKLVYIK